MSSCFCGGPAGTAAPNQSQVKGSISRIFLVPTYGSDGTRNSIKASEFVDGKLPDTYFQDKINEANKADRFYPIKPLKNVDPTRTDPIVQTYTDGSTSVIRKGTRVMSALIPVTDPAYIAKIESIICNSFGVIEIDNCGIPWGEWSADKTEFYPYTADAPSFIADEFQKNDTDNQAITINYNYSVTEKAENSTFIPLSSFSENLLTIPGIFDLMGELSNISTTSFDITLEYCYGSFPDHIPYEGLELADLDVYNVTADAGITLLTLDPTTEAGTYTATFAAQTSADQFTVNLSASVTGFDMETLTGIIP